MTTPVTTYPTQDPNNADDIDEELSIPDDHGRVRSTARWLALQILYEIDVTEHPRGEVITHHLSRYTLQTDTRDYTYRLVNGALDHVERLDMILQTIAQEHPLDQVAVIDRNVLRIALFEYTMIGGLPTGVVADEAVQLARQFGSDSAPRFVNGVLGAIFSNEPRLQAMLAAELPPDDEDDEYDDDEPIGEDDSDMDEA